MAASLNKLHCHAWVSSADPGRSTQEAAPTVRPFELDLLFFRHTPESRLIIGMEGRESNPSCQHCLPARWSVYRGSRSVLVTFLQERKREDAG